MRLAIPTLGLLFLTACSNVMDADLTERSTFIKLFSGVEGIEAADCQITEDGYIILGNMTDNNDSLITVVIKADVRGNRIGSIHYYGGGTGSALHALPNGNGYLIVGEQVKIDPTQGITDNIVNRSSRMLIINNELDSIKTIYRRDESNNDIITDYRAVALTVSNDNIIILGTYQTNLSQPERPYLEVYTNDLGVRNWRMDFESEGRSYKNAKSIHYSGTNIIWASAIAASASNFNYSWVSVPVVPIGDTFTNASVLGATTPNGQLFIPSDIKAYTANSFGYGIIGTHSNPDGTSSNIFFLRADTYGNIIPTSLRFYDAIRTAENKSVTKVESEVQDFGTALTATSDGGFILAGHYITAPPNVSDIVLIKIDALGNTVWIKTIGGTGSETVSTVLETEDRGILICGTHIIGAIPSIFLIKTDRNGELTN